MEQAERRGIRREDIAGETVFISHETYTPARGGSAAAEIHALRAVFGENADRVVIANVKGYTGHPMGVGLEDVLAVKALETGIVPPVPNFRDPDPELGVLNLSGGGAYPVRYSLRLAAGFGSQISMLLLRWTPVADGRRRNVDELGYDYRIADRAAWEAWLRRASGYEDPEARGRTAPAADRRSGSALGQAAGACPRAGSGPCGDRPRRHRVSVRSSSRARREGAGCRAAARGSRGAGSERARAGRRAGHRAGRGGSARAGARHG